MVMVATATADKHRPDFSFNSSGTSGGLVDALMRYGQG